LVEFLLDNCCGGQSCLPKPLTRKVKALWSNTTFYSYARTTRLVPF
jgi:hypothetical protein